MNTLIKNVTLVSMSENREKIEENIDVLVENGHFAQIEKNINIEVDEVIDANGKVLIPGLINMHSHVPMSLFREITDGCSLQEWLEEKIWPIEDTLTGEDMYKYALKSFKEMVYTGSTTINDQYCETASVIKAGIESGIRIELTRTLMDASGNGDTRLRELEEIIEEYNGKYDNVTINVGIHGLYTCGPDMVKRGTDLARKYGLNVHMHFCENTKEVEDIKRIHGVEYPSQVLEKYFNGVNTILAHCVKLEKRDMQVIKDMNMSVVHCPVSNLRLACGISKVEEMRNMGINVTLGTDGQGSGSNLDMFESMKFACLLQKGEFENPYAMPAYEVLKMATVNGAKALRLEKEIGSIEVGKKADMVLLNLDTPTTQPINELFADIVYNANRDNVVATWVDGRKLYCKM